MIFGLADDALTSEIAAVIYMQDRRRVLGEGDADFIAKSVVYLLHILDGSETA